VLAQVEQELVCSTGMASQHEEVARLIQDHHLTDDDRWPQLVLLPLAAAPNEPMAAVLGFRV
jgi:hypothetical protein